MKIFKVTLTAVLITFALLSCSKDKEIAPRSATGTDYGIGLLKGMWEGECTTTNRAPAFYLAVNIKPGGGLDMLNESHHVVGSGTWSLDGLNFNAMYKVDSTDYTYSMTGNLYDPPTRLEGSWKFGEGYEHSGFWVMDKK